MLSIEYQIITKIKNNKRGKLFFPDDFTHLGSSEAVRLSLHRLVKRKILVRLAKGIYLYPKIDNELGILYPSTEKVVEAIAKRDKVRIVPTGVQALNRLGLSSQIPLKAVYLTDGTPRSIQVGKRTIVFKKTTPKNLSIKGDISKLVIQALRAIGQKNLTDDQLNKIISILRKEKPENIIQDARMSPVWISKILISSLNSNSK